jgi:hypothetical protein
MSVQVHVVAIITPAQGKESRVSGDKGRGMGKSAALIWIDERSSYELGE